ncbi:LysR family transcriptional regulator [Roseateles sp. NT4]|uniref:LysR family transcriptional regulator n=1 Tax=Roseateles sp. NT4 TaxID=3453715 RepID=UPI003EEDDD56
MNLRQLSHLIALADEGRFVAAAERVHLSQAAFSRSIQALEEDWGLRLFERGPLGAVLTPAGRTLVERARRLVFDADCLERDAALLRGGLLGELAFGAGPVPAAVLVPPLLAELRRQAPQIVARVRYGNVPSLLTLLTDEAIEFFIADPRMLGDNSRVEIAPVSRIRGSVYARAGHPLLGASRVTAADLTHYGLGLVSVSAQLQAYVAQGLGFASPADLPVVVECDDLTTLARLAADGDLLAALPRGLPLIDSLGLQPIKGLKTLGELYVDAHAVWLRGRTLAPAAETALSLVRAMAGSGS